uniref:Zinc finger ccch domain-containing protein 40-like n=1 Tax=Tetraselmis sp. GSL018 TaxID=582737 RepID=A0A061QTU5_9CHLO
MVASQGAADPLLLGACRYKKTIICQEVAKQKNVCQVCLLDLEYNLPVQVRDHALNVEDENDQVSEVNKEFALKQAEETGERPDYSTKRPNDLLLKLQRTTPYYKRNRAQICSFFVRGECKRGAECPYRHEMPEGGELAEQNIKDRYYGVNDPVANKMLRRAGDMPTLTPPEDKSIMTLYVGGLNNSITEKDLEDVFYAHGEIKSIKKIESRSCAFVTYTSRLSAEAAAESLANRLIIKGTRLKLMWGKPQPPPQPRPDPMQPSTSGAPAPPIAMVPPQMQMQMGAARPFMPAPNFFNLPTPESGGAPMYPSMDPTAMGTRVPALGEPPKDPYEGSEDEPSKRQRMDALPAGGMGPMSGHGMHPPPPMMMSRPPMPPPPMPPPAHQ